MPVNVARCGKGKDVCPLGIGADDVGPCCCVVTHRGDLLQRVVGPAHEEIAHTSNAVGDAGNVVGVVLDFPTNVTCRVPAQCGLEGSHVGLCRAAGTRLPSGFMTAVSSHVKKAVRGRRRRPMAL